MGTVLRGFLSFCIAISDIWGFGGPSQTPWLFCDSLHVWQSGNSLCDKFDSSSLSRAFKLRVGFLIDASVFSYQANITTAVQDGDLQKLARSLVQFYSPFSVSTRFLVMRLSQQGSSSSHYFWSQRSSIGGSSFLLSREGGLLRCGMSRVHVIERIRLCHGAGSSRRVAGAAGQRCISGWTSTTKSTDSKLAKTKKPNSRIHRCDKRQKQCAGLLWPIASPSVSLAQCWW